MLGIKAFLRALRIFPKASTEIDSLGEFEVLSSDNKARFHNGTTASPVVTESHSSTLTNKTINGPDNTITNLVNANIGTTASIAYTKLNLTGSIVDADVSATAALDASKIANGSVSSVEFQYLDGVSSPIQTQLNAKTSTTLADGKIYLGDASNVAQQVTPSGDVTISNTGVTAITADSIVNADISSTAAIAYSKLSLTDAIQNADVSTVAAIARTKLASGTANHVIINDGSGVMSSEAALDETRGGTAQTTFTTGDILYASATDTLSKLGVGSAGQVLGVVAGTPAWTAAGGAGGVNFVGLDTSWVATNINDRNADTSVGNWVAYADAAGATPVDMTGGSPTVTIARTTTSGEV